MSPGEVVALVGPSGAGKSSCIQLLERFYDPDVGQVLLDGKPLSDYDQTYLHQKVSLVSQEPKLMARTVKENIVYGMEDVSDETIIEAAKDANAHDFIQTLCNQYQTEVGEFGTGVSGMH